MISRLQAPCHGWPVPLAYPVTTRASDTDRLTRRPDSLADAEPVIVPSISQAKNAVPVANLELHSHHQQPTPLSKETHHRPNHGEQQRDQGPRSMQTRAEADRKVQEEEQAMIRAAQMAAAATAAESLDARQPPAYVHEHISRTDSEDLLMPHIKEPGVWLVRKRDDTGASSSSDASPLQQAYVFVVTFNQKVTHHLVMVSDSGSTFNGKSCPGCCTIEEVVDYLKQKPQFFPISLSRFIPNQSASGDIPNYYQAMADTSEPALRDAALLDLQSHSVVDHTRTVPVGGESYTDTTPDAAQYDSSARYHQPLDMIAEVTAYTSAGDPYSEIEYSDNGGHDPAEHAAQPHHYTSAAAGKEYISK